MKLRLGQVKTLPVKGDVAANGRRLMEILGELAPERPDVVITPECFLDGYMANNEKVSAEDLRRYAVDPAASPEVLGVAEWAAAHHTWVVLGCSRAAP